MGSEVTYTSDWTLSVHAIAFLVVIATLLGIHVTRFCKRYRYFRRLPCPKYSPLFGNIHLYPSDGEGQISMMRSVMEEVDPKVSVFWMSAWTPHLLIYHPDTMKDVVLSSVAYKPRGPGGAYEFGAPWIGEGLITSNGAYWTRSRRLLNPTFHNHILKTYIQVYNEAGDKLMAKLDRYAESGQSFDLFPLITNCSLEIVLKCILGYETDIQGHEPGQHPYAQAVLNLTDTWLKRFWNPLIWYDCIFWLTPIGRRFKRDCDYVHEVSEKLIKERQTLLESGQIAHQTKHLNFIDILLLARDEDEEPLNPREIRDQVDSFVFAGHDTTSTSVTFNLYNLAIHKAYQQKVQKEIDSIMDERETDQVMWEDFPKLKTLGICSKESMRLYAPVPLVTRELIQDETIGGHEIPKGTVLQLAIHMLHKNPAVWDKPDDYVPERFLKEDVSRYAFAPFSAGARNCIGQNFAQNVEKVLLTKILRRYNVSVAPDYEGPQRRLASIMKSDNGVWFTLEKR